LRFFQLVRQNLLFHLRKMGVVKIGKAWENMRESNINSSMVQS
jgi:hypothetical protein